MNLFKNDIQGDLNVSRKLNVGSHTDIKGELNVGHNVMIQGWLDAPNIKGAFKGLYESETTLKSTYPEPQPGWFALVGNTVPAPVYRVKYDETSQKNVWVATGQTGGQFQVFVNQIETRISAVIDRVATLESLTNGGILLTNGVTFESTTNTASLKLKFLMPNGDVKEYPYSIPIVSATQAGMMTAADKQELTKATNDIKEINTKITEINTKIKDLTDRTVAVENGLKEVEKKQETTDANLAQLRKEFDTLVSGNASTAIDNFNEICAFLEGIEDSETLLAKLAALSLECENNKKELQANIDAEKKAREDADKALSDDFNKKIEAEAKARGDKDDTHDSQILELEKAVWPLELTLSANPMLIEVGVQTNVTLSWEVRRRNKDVTADSVNTINSVLVTGKSKVYTVNESTEKELSYILTAIFEGLTESKTVKPKVTYPTYFGSVANTWTPSEASVKGLAKSLKGTREATYTGISTNNGKIAYCYPASFGNLTSVKDGNGYEVIESYTKTTLSVNGVTYNCYLLTIPVTSSGVTQIYK